MHRNRRRSAAALAAVVGVSAVSLVAFAGPADAHVTVSSADAKPGGYGVVAFRMPNEEAKATTTRLQVQLPSDTPLAFVATQPIPGWTAVVVKGKLPKPLTTADGVVTEAAQTITWVAKGDAAIQPGEFQLFNVEMGPLPKKDEVVFPAIQTYSNGDVVKWVERQAPGSSQEPEHPAPELKLTGATTTSDQASATVAPTAATKSSSNTGPIVLSIIALVLAAGALGLAVVNRARRSS